MKIKKEHQKLFQDWINEFMQNKMIPMDEAISHYENGEHYNAKKTGDLTKRFRWDIWNHASSNRLQELTKIMRENGYYDSHINTLLKKLIPVELTKKY